ncbi:MAG TPA: TIM barrel protein [Propionibacteriaceae bacterium]|nr:TIM barrel protein [Propionibacteriaceae bacterium]
MYATIGPNQLGIHNLSLSDAIALARDAGFVGLSFDSRAVARAVDEHGLAAVQDQFAQAGVKPALWGLPVAWRDDDQWEADLRELARLAATARALGATRTTTYMPSGSDERPFRENFDWHVARLRPIAEVLRDEGCRFGIEFIGPKTYRAAFRHEFIHTLDGVMELVAAIGTSNVGVLLDSWHLYTSGGTLANLARLTNHDVVVVHVNDAPAGITRDEQIDTVRALPMETGVIDLVGFMRALQEMGYDGPVMPEPFSQRLNDLAATDPGAAAREAARSMNALWRAAGLRVMDDG